MREEMLWVEKYRPKSINDCVLPKSLKDEFQSFVDKKEVPNLLLESRLPGSGKTSSVKALMDELNLDYMFINASLETSIEVLRTKMADFASTHSMTGSRKYIVLDEADALPKNNQLALRGMIEEFSINCGFILTCNTVDNIIDPIQSRLLPMDFNFDKKEYPQLMRQFMKRAQFILNDNNIKFENNVVAGLIKNNTPDFRRIVNQLQKHSLSGTIGSDIVLSSNLNIEQLINSIKDKDFKSVRQFIEQNKDMDIDNLYWKLYNELYSVLEPASIPDVILILSDYQKYSPTVPNKILNLLGCLVEIMGNTTFK